MRERRTRPTSLSCRHWQPPHEFAVAVWVVSPVGLRPPCATTQTATRYVINRQKIHLSEAKRCSDQADHLCLFPVLGATGSAAERSALFVGFTATTTESDFSGPCIISPIEFGDVGRHDSVQFAEQFRNSRYIRRGTPPDAVYIFKHALVQDAAYDWLLKSRRQALHAKIARVIEQHLPNIRTIEPEGAGTSAHGSGSY